MGSGHGSTDGSLGVLDTECKKYGFEYVRLTENKGVGPAVNHAIKLGIVDGNNVVLAHSDIEVLGPWAQDMESMLVGRVGQVEAKVKIHDGTCQYGGTVFLLLSRDMLSEIGLFSTEFFQAEDEDFRVRIHAAGWTTAYCKTTNIFHRGGGTLQGVLKDAANGSPLIKENVQKFFNKYTPGYLEAHHHVTVAERNRQPLD